MTPIICNVIDVDFDCRQDSPKPNSDPDSVSRTLRLNHQDLWSKPLPNGKIFELDVSCPIPFLAHRTDREVFELTSDHIRRTLADRKAVKPLVALLPLQMREFAVDRSWPVHDCIVFPGRTIKHPVTQKVQMTINRARGTNRLVGDRFDLTLECIRRHYVGSSSPLSEILDRYSSFFGLFESFEGYVDFFWLQDLVDSKSESVLFHLPFDNFQSLAIPRDPNSYVQYLSGLQTFHQRRAERVREWCAATR